MQCLGGCLGIEAALPSIKPQRITEEISLECAHQFVPFGATRDGAFFEVVYGIGARDHKHEIEMF